MNDSIEQTYGAEKPGYYVYREGGRSPTKRHPNRFGACKEAKRLCESDAGSTYHVLKVRATFTNTDPIESLGFDNNAKQTAAREGMSPGGIVVVNKDHYRYAGEIGYIDRLGDGDDLSVYVNLTGDIIRFSPSSLTLKSKRPLSPSERVSIDGFAASASEDREPLFSIGDMVHYTHRGESRVGRLLTRIDGRWAIFDIINREAVVGARFADEDLTPVTQEAKADDTEPMGVSGALSLLAAIAASSIARSLARRRESEATGGEDAPEAMAQYAKVRTIPIGTEVMVIHEPAGLFNPATAFKAKLARFDDNPKFVWVQMMSDDGELSDPIQANASRIIRADDPAMVVI